MNRRGFLKRIGLLSVAAALPIPVEEWIWECMRGQDDFWWTFLAQHVPTGVRYGWKVSEQHLIDRGMTPEDFKRFSITRLNPYYAS